jgi:hypothetical protein
MRNILPLLHSCPGGVCKSTFRGPWQIRRRLSPSARPAASRIVQQNDAAVARAMPCHDHRPVWRLVLPGPGIRFPSLPTAGTTAKARKPPNRRSRLWPAPRFPGGGQTGHSASPTSRYLRRFPYLQRHRGRCLMRVYITARPVPSSNSGC